MSTNRLAAADSCAFVVQEAFVCVGGGLVRAVLGLESPSYGKGEGGDWGGVDQAGWTSRAGEIETGRFSSRFSRLGHSSGLESAAARPRIFASSCSFCTDVTVHEYRPNLPPGDSGL